MKYERIQELRENHFWTQEYVAHYLHVSQRAYSHYENGIRQLPVSVLIRLAFLYNVSADYLLGLSNVPHYGKRQKSIRGGRG